MSRGKQTKIYLCEKCRNPFSAAEMTDVHVKFEGHVIFPKKGVPRQPLPKKVVKK